MGSPRRVLGRAREGSERMRGPRPVTEGTRKGPFVFGGKGGTAGNRRKVHSVVSGQHGGTRAPRLRQAERNASPRIRRGPSLRQAPLLPLDFYAFPKAMWPVMFFAAFWLGVVPRGVAVTAPVPQVVVLAVPFQRHR